MSNFWSFISSSFLNIHWWVVAIGCAFILWKASPSSRFWWSLVITYGLVFLYETYIVKDQFLWLPYLAVIAVMCSISNLIVYVIREEPSSQPTQNDPAEEDEAILYEWDDDLYPLVREELEQGKQDTTLWAKLYAANSGDEKKIKVEYIDSRVKELAGNRTRICGLGVKYYKGKGVKKDYSKAAEYFLEAAKLGNRPALHNIGSCYYTGEGVDKDYAKALEWFLRAAEMGSPLSQCGIGNIYRDGLGVTQDIEEAKKWYLMSAKQGDKDAKKALEEI